MELRRLWEARKGHQAYPVVLLAWSDDVNKVRVAGPQDARPVRELRVSRVLDLLETSRSLAAREAASFLAREFSRLEDALVARAYGLTIDDLRFIFTDFTENAVSPAYRRQVLEKFEGL